MIKLICFDLDGVLLDALPIHEAAFLKALETISGITMTKERHRRDFEHRPTKTKLQMLVERGELSAGLMNAVYMEKQRITVSMFADLVHYDAQKCNMMEWVSRFFFVSLCSNAIKLTCDTAMEKMKIKGFVHLIVSNETTGIVPKPAPDMYLRAMEYFRCKPDETLILEDSELGLKAAYASGAHVLEIFDVKHCTLELIQKRLEVIDYVERL